MTTDFGHTKGPWMATRSLHDSRVVICTDHGHRIDVATTYAGGCGVPVEANARLIAASPELLSALIGIAPILATAESNASGNPEWEAVSSRINAARAAIAKATGQ